MTFLSIRENLQVLHPCVYSIIRQRLPAFILFGSILSVGLLPDPYTTWAVIFFSAAAVILTVAAYQNSRAAKKKIGGRILEFYYSPTPMGSLIDALNKNNIDAEVISKVTLMSANLRESLKYFDEGSKEGRFRDILDRCKNMKVTVYGKAYNQDTRSSHERIKIIPTESQLLEHINLIETNDGKFFVWYEPYHNVIDGVHYFTRGAYLMAVNEEEKNRVDQIYRDLALQ